MVPSVLHICVSEELFFSHLHLAWKLRLKSPQCVLGRSIFFYALRCYLCIGEGWVRVVPGSSTKTTKLLKHCTSSKAKALFTWPLSLIPEWMQWSGTNWMFKRKWNKQTNCKDRKKKEKKKKSRFPSDKRLCPFMPGKFQLSMLRRMGGTRL